MPAVLETQQPEFGDDRSPEAMVARLNEMLDAPSAPDPFEARPAPGEFAVQKLSRFGGVAVRGVRQAPVNWRDMAIGRS